MYHKQFVKNISTYFLPPVYKSLTFSHLNDLHLINNADSQKNIFIVNVSVIESRNTTACNNEFYKSLVRPPKKTSDVKVDCSIFGTMF